ncbi:MATE family efflux transporter [Myroides sp. LJL119]
MTSSISFKDINKLAIPAIFAGISESILSLTDIAMVGNLKHNSVEALAAVGLVGSFLSAIIWVVAQTKTSISATVSQHLGSGRLFAVKTLIPQAILFNFALSVILFVTTTWFVHEIFVAYQASGLILQYAKQYYLIRAWGFPLTLISFAIFGVFRGLQNTIWAMKCSITGAIINVVLDYLLVFGIQDYIQPLGVMGAAYASVFAQGVMLCMAMYYYLKYTPFSLKIRKKINPSLKPLIIMSFNFIIRTATLNITLYMASKYATGYGKDFIAAQSILMNIWLFFSFFIDGYASAGNALSGRLLGEKNFKLMWQMIKKISLYSVIISLILIAICLLLYNKIGLIFNSDPNVNNIFTSVFWIVLIMQPINALAYIFDGVYKGMGDAKFLRNNLLFATFLGYIPTLLIADYLGLQMYGIWLAFAVWMCLRSFPVIYVFKKNYVDR